MFCGAARWAISPNFPALNRFRNKAREMRDIRILVALEMAPVIHSRGAGACSGMG